MDQEPLRCQGCSSRLFASLRGSKTSRSSPFPFPPSRIARRRAPVLYSACTSCRKQPAMHPQRSNPMTTQPFPAPEDLTICFAHIAYQLEPIFARRQADLRARTPAGQERIPYFQVWTPDDLTARLPRGRRFCSFPDSGKTSSLNARAPPAFSSSRSAPASTSFDLDALRQRGHPPGPPPAASTATPSANTPMAPDPGLHPAISTPAATASRTMPGAA